MALKLPLTGRCYCGAIRYRVTEEPVTFYACHCTDCQKRTGSAFNLSMWVWRRSIEVTQGEPALQASAGNDGKPRHARVCGACAVRLWSEPGRFPEYAILRPGSLDDTKWLRPAAHIWTRSAQPWFAFPEGVPKFEQQAGLDELARLWRERSPR